MGTFASRKLKQSTNKKRRGLLKGNYTLHKNRSFSSFNSTITDSISFHSVLQFFRLSLVSIVLFLRRDRDASYRALARTGIVLGHLLLLLLPLVEDAPESDLDESKDDRPHHHAVNAGRGDASLAVAPK
jgi:hypothetical protein